MASSASALPWLWVIEALASFKQVDASVLTELVKKVPEISGDLGKDAREMIHFRVLDILASRQIGRNRSVPPAPVSEKIFHPSERCEDVVSRMLRERATGAEMIKPQAQNFIAQKSALLPKCTLLKLKDAILEGKHPALASLKAKSGLSNSSQPKDRAHISEERNLTSQNEENSNDFSHEQCPNRNLTPLNRDSCNLERENQFLRSHIDSPRLNNGVDTNLHITKKLKLVDEPELDLPVTEANMGGGTSNAAPPNQAHENACEKSQPAPSNGVPHDKSHTKKISFEAQCATENDSGRECSSDSDGYREERVQLSSRKCDFLNSQCTFTQESLATDDCTELNICMKCEKIGDLLICSVNSCPIVVHQSCLGIPPSFDNSGKFFCPFCSYSRVISDYLKIKKKRSLIRNDLAVFLGKENEHGPNKVAKRSIWLEKNQRRQDDSVNRNDQLHQNDVNDISDPLSQRIIGENSIRPGQKQQRNDEIFRINDQVHQNDISDLLGQRIIGEKSIRLGQNQGRNDDNICRNDQVHQIHVNEISDSKNKANTGDKTQGEPSISRVNGNPCLRVEGSLQENGMIFSSKERDKEGGEIGPYFILEREEVEAQARQDEGDNSLSYSEREFVPIAEKNAPRVDNRGQKVDLVESSEEEDDQTASDYIMMPRKKVNRHSCPYTPQLRRKKVLWTTEEEEALKEGVKQFTGDHDKNMQWKKILEFGSRVFQKGRTAADLKDKWRNICKRQQ